MLTKAEAQTIWTEPFPCRACPNAHVCNSSEIDCKAFRMYTNTGSWNTKDVGKLMRPVNWSED